MSANAMTSETAAKERLVFWLTLDALPGIGPVKAARLLQAFNGDIGRLFSAPSAALNALGLTDGQQMALHQPSDLVRGQIEESLHWASEAGHHLLSQEHQAYPQRLKEIAAAPLLLYCQGELANLSLPQIAMVGTRHPTYSGKDNAARLVAELVQAGLAITSGLALGIDGVCHQQALACQGKTIAVLGSGLNVIYPKRHQGLAMQIVAQGGTLLSELLPNQGPLAEHFPRRNRIISGLSLGTVVVEAAEQSGSLITTRYALEQGREVFALPGALQNEQAIGCNKLIQQGAKLVLTGADIVEELSALLGPYTASPTDCAVVSDVLSNLPLSYQALLDNVDYEATSVDTIAERTQLPVEVILGHLVELELLGVVIAVAGGYVRARRGNHV